jgi:Rrp15p
MARKTSHFGKKAGKQAERLLDDKYIGRFAGSSDEEGESDRGATITERGTEAEESDIEKETERAEGLYEDVDTMGQPFVTNESAGEADPGQKMAGVMAKILGTSTNASRTSSVVLAKTTTPLQRLQRKETEKLQAVKLKRQANRERNLAALHIPLSVATSINIDEGRISITKELEQERFHRRVATRGVVALFNAISQHQNSATASTLRLMLSRERRPCVVCMVLTCVLHVL